MSRSDLKAAKNIGATVEKRLNEVGVFTLADLAEITPAKAYQRICEKYPDETIPICYYFYPLEGVLRGVHWNGLSIKVKGCLRKQASVVEV